MANINEAAAKWARKTANAGAKWKDAVGRGDYCGGFQAFVGHPTPEACSAWSQGVSAVTAAEFQSRIAGKEGKYIAGLNNVR